MFSILWRLLVGLRYILYFLFEVSDEDARVTKQDTKRALTIRKVLKAFFWRGIFFSIFWVIVIFGVVPIYSKNSALEQSLKDRDRTIEKLEKEKEQAVNNQFSAMNNTHLCNVKLTSLMDENKRLTRLLETKPSSLISPRKPTEKTNKTNKVSTAIESRLKGIE